MKSRHFYLGQKEMRFMLAVLLGIETMMISWTNAGTRRDVEKEILIKFKSGVSLERINQLTKENGLEILERFLGVENLYLCRIRMGLNTRRSEVLKILNRYTDIEYAEANQKVEALE